MYLLDLNNNLNSQFLFSLGILNLYNCFLFIFFRILTFEVFMLINFMQSQKDNYYIKIVQLIMALTI